MKKHSIGAALVCAVLAAIPPEVRPQATPTPSATIAASLFTKEKVAARVLFLPTGGAINLTPRKSGDSSTLEMLRDQATSLEEQMRRGDFALLFKVMKEDSEFVDWMKKNDGAVKIRTRATPTGTHVEFSTTTGPARTAVHEFLRRVHGKPMPTDEVPSKFPGRDLGRDANLKVPRK